MFLDEATITVMGGAGGNGCTAWRREKFIPKGGPAGGDGGKGGSVILEANENTDTLSDFAARKKFDAERGEHGMGKQMNGRSGEDLVLPVPPGTLVSSVDPDSLERTLIADLENHGDRIMVARGGRGGFGNAHFKNSIRQKPDFAELGEPGETRVIHLDLKLVADIAIIGYPSVGKSTLISVISAARPKIADYPFTTLIPNLGVVHVDDRSYVVCDVPGLIEGASEGKGLGHRFLRHIERCGTLLHLLDVSRALDGARVNPQKLVDDYHAIRRELAAYSERLAGKEELVLLNKVDLMQDDVQALVAALKKAGITIFAPISAATQGGTHELMKALLQIVLEARKKREFIPDDEKSDSVIPVLEPHLLSEKMQSYRIEEVNGEIVIRGKRVEQFTAMTNFMNEDAVRRFRDVLERTGILKGIRTLQKDRDLPVLIGMVRVDEYL